ncbi:MAG: SusD/RagB family nutrient-binding outer membrane lipoprotein [Bacteroidetes bacterium]|nr:MAG: SusD/RagB family nutrient-binding outer membrane lipoprotein [Bacteroidota bacterium]
MLTLILGFASCDMTEMDLQQNPNAVSPEQANVNNIYNNVVLDFNDFVGSHWHFTGGLSRMRNWTGGFTYNDAYSPSSLNFTWNEAYAVLLPDIDALIALSDEKGLGIHGGSARIMKAYILTTLVDLFGDVPYSEALQGTDIISPKDDPGDQVYAAADALLDEAITVLSNNTGAAPENDLYYGGDASKWITLANSLKLRNAVTTRLVNTNAASIINKLVADGDIIDDMSEDFQFTYGNNRTNPDTRSPFYTTHYESDDGIYMSNYYMWLLNGEKLDADGNEVIDPRIRYYFYRQVSDAFAQDVNVYSCIFSDLPDPAFTPQHYLDVDPRMPYCVLSNGYYGRDHMNGSGIPPDGPIRTVYGVYPGGGKFDDNSFDGVQNQGQDGAQGAGINPILLSSFLDLMRAEAAVTLGTNDDAAALLERAIRTSIAKTISFGPKDPNYTIEFDDPVVGPITPQDKFEPSEDAINDYVAVVMDKFNNSDDDGKLDVIIKELYIALWGNGLEAYNAYRRTCKPGNIQPTIEPASGDFASSALYPASHVDLNANATQKSITEPVWWDTNSTGCAY